MLDPFTLLGTATAIFSGLKKAVELGREAEDVFKQLSKWAGAVSDLQEWMNGEENRKPSIFKALKFTKSATEEAFDAYAAKVRIREMETELYNWFHYGELQHLGREGYIEFIQMRRSVKEAREKQVYEQLRMRKKFVKVTSEAALIGVVVTLGGIILFHIISFIIEHSP